MFRKISSYFSALIFVSVLFSGQAHAGVTVSISDVVSPLLQNTDAVCLAVALFFLRKLPGPLVSFLQIFRVDQLMAKAISYGINSAEGAASGKTLTIATGLNVLDEALGYTLTHGPQSLVEWMGGPQAIAEKLWARLPLEEAAKKTNLSTIVAKNVNAQGVAGRK